MTRHSSLASTAIDRRDDYFAKVEVRQREDFPYRHRRGLVVQRLMRRMWKRKGKARV